MNIKTNGKPSSCCWVFRMMATVLALAAVTTPTTTAAPVGTSFTYQGQLKQDGVPVDGLVDFDCSVWDSQSGGAELAGTTLIGVDVTDGLFTIDVDFGPGLFNGSARWLEIQVAYPSGAAFTPMVGRQAITPVPYAMTALKTVGVDGYSLDAQDGNPADAVRVDYQGKVLMEKGGLLVFDDQGHGISLTSDTFDFIEGTSEDPVYSYSSIDDTHEFYTNGNRRMVIDADGHIGIGTSTPTNYLSLWGNANIMGYLGIGDATPTSQLSVGIGGKFLVSGFDGDLTFTDDMGTIKFPPTDGTNSAMIEMFTSGFNNGDRMVIQHSQRWQHGLQFEDSTNRFHFINTGGGRLMSIDLMQSKVGIGQEAPIAKLHIGGTPGVDGIMFPDGTLQTTANGGGGFWAESVGDIYYNSGNVGIGEVNPVALLHLGGTPGADGIMFPDGTLQTTAAVVGGGGSSWALSGNAGTTPGAHFVGTIDNQPLELHAGGFRALRIEPTDGSPNLIGGHQENVVDLDVVGATIGGGGAVGAANRVTDAGGAIGGGVNNRAGDDAGTTIDAADATVAGGFSNIASGPYSAVGGGRNNTASGIRSAVGGGYNNNATDSHSVVSGGGSNNASGNHGTVAGGAWNTASGGLSAVGGGDHNEALGYKATVPGGSYNQASGTYSFAAGQRAHAIYEGSFVWSDSTTIAPDLFRSTGVDQFLVKATGGVGINTDSPGASLHIGGVAGTDGIMFPDGTLQTTAATGGGSGDGNSLDAVDGSPTDVVHVNADGRVNMYDGGLFIYDDAGHGISITSDDYTFNQKTSGDPLYYYSSDSDTHSFHTNNKRVLSIAHNGSVGIGMGWDQDPAAKLHINGTAGTDGIMFPDGTLQTTAAAGGGSSLWTASADDIFYNTGDVGIGTSSPGARLHVIDPVGYAIRGECVGEGTHGYLGHEHAGVFGEVDSPTGFASWFEGRGYYSGNLGLGVTSPSAKLHIGGTAGVDGIKFPDGTLQTTAAVGGGGAGVWSQSSSNIYYTAGKVGVGTSSPSHLLHVESSESTVIYAKTTSTSTYARAVQGDNNSIAGAGVSGDALASSGSAAGVSGGAQSPNGVGVLGYNDHEVGPSIGVRGVTVSPTGFGGYFEGRGYFSGNVGIGTDSPVSKLHITGPDDPVTGALLTLNSDTPGSRESGRIRFRGSNSSLRGAFIHYDDLGYKLHIGTHQVTNFDPADDVNSITISRLNGNVGIGTTATSWPLNVGGDSFFNARVGIGGLSTEAKLHVEGNTRVEGSIGIRTAPLGGVMLDMNGDSIYGMRSETTRTGGLAVIGNASAASGGGTGVLGSATSPNGTGVRGSHIASTGTAAGVHGTTAAAEDFAAGVKGEATSTTAWNITTGVTGISHAYSGIGVYGKATSTSTLGFPTSGGYFEADAANGVGVKAVGNGSNGYGGYFVGRGYFSGNVGIGVVNPTTKLDVAGWTRTEVLEITGGADLSEQFDVAAQGERTVEPGMVVVIDADHPGKLVLSDSPYDRKVAGVISGAGGVRPGMIMGQRGTMADGEHPVALTGRVWTWCDTSGGAIRPGDLLTTSSEAGHAMKVGDHTRAQGAIIGKAMSALTQDAGLVLVLVSLQ